MIKRIWLLGLALVSVVALIAPPLFSSPASSGIAASATGNGELTAFCGATRTFSFTAQKDSAGNTTGQAQLVNRCSGLITEIKINCLSVSGNVATMSGTIVSSNFDIAVGMDTWFRVADNGEGANAPPDQMTLALTSDPGTGPTCSEDVNLALHNILSGNIQVH
jgi:hypothetical protein